MSPSRQARLPKKLRLWGLLIALVLGLFLSRSTPSESERTQVKSGSPQSADTTSTGPSDQGAVDRNTPGAALQEPGLAEVVRVVDGDTIVVKIQGQEEKIRLIGINTPESVDPRKPVECFGKEASNHAAELLPEGTQVRLVRDVEARDRYGRLLAYVYRESDGLFVNLAQVADGFAEPATYPPNVAHVDDFTAAARTAREQNRGLWSSC